MPYYRHRHRRPRFNRSAKPAITVTSGVQAKKARCHGCHGWVTPGEQYVRFSLRKAYRRPCNTCGHEPKRSRRFHQQCAPTDINKTMGYDPNASPPGAAVPPPPKPKTFHDLELDALVSLEAALVGRVRSRGSVTPDLEAAFRKFQGIKARVLRPGTEAEGEVATSLALQQLVKLVFAQ